MKRVAVAAFLFSSLVVFAECQEAPDPADQFANHFSAWLTLRKHQVTPEEKDALRKVHRLLLLASRENYLRKYFWRMVSGTIVKEIEWDEAKDMILRGQVISVGQTHALEVEIIGLDGIEYRTREPNIDDVLRLVKEVDPKKVFIDYGTE